jgi:hypothetical protein
MRVRTRFFTATLPFLLLTAWLPSAAEVFLVTDTIDAIPAPVGTLRWAIEQSEANNVPDSIEFTIDGGTIVLVAPLPDLREGGLSIGERRPTGTPTPGNGIAISGINGVSRAIRILSADNTIANLDFIEFGGPEAILIDGRDARRNAIARNVFGRDNATGVAGVGLRIGSPDNLGTPTDTEVRVNRFINGSAGIVIEGDGTSAIDASTTVIQGNWFGTDPNGGPGPGTGNALRAEGAGRIDIQGNRLSGPGAGIFLGAGSGRSFVRDNQIGLESEDGTACSGFTGAGVRVEGSPGVTIRDNGIRCNDIGIHLAIGADEAQIRDNHIGSGPADANRSHGILLDPGEGALIRRNSIVRNAGFGITSTNAPIIDPTKGALLACNSIFSNLLGALNLPGVLTSPPVLTGATVERVDGDLPDVVPGWVEIFGDAGNQAGTFQGALRLDNTAPPFSHRLPVLNLRVDKAAGGAEISFERTTPANHTATLSDESMNETTELSLELPAETLGLTYDVIRGDLAALAFGATGGIDLGQVTCLDSGLTPDLVANPNPIDPDIPPVGHGFFYVSRRKDSTANTRGTYDPAICLTDVDAFFGPRRPAGGDCL